MSLPILQAVDVEAIARSLSITHHVTGTRQPWEPHGEQRLYR